jgi:hypothetical protein
MKTRLTAALVVILGFCLAVQAQSPSTKKIYAQKLVDDIFAKRNDLVSMGIHVTPPGQSDNVIIASNVPSKIGKKSSDDDMGVMRTGTPLIKLKGEDVYDIVLPMYVSSGKTIGIIGMNLRCKKGESEASALKRARQIVAGLKRHTPSESKLFEEVR